MHGVHLMDAQAGLVLPENAPTARRLILDVDTGTDDAIAIMLAALHLMLERVGVTTVNGNVIVEHGTKRHGSVSDDCRASFEVGMPPIRR